MRHDFSPALIAIVFFSIVAGKISLYTSSRFLGYAPPFLKNLLVKARGPPLAGFGVSPILPPFPEKVY